MRCPFCDADKESLKVIDSRTCEGGKAIRRRRQCLNCEKRFTTYERIEEMVKLTVVKKDGARQPFDRAKVRTGLERACFKRPIPESELDRLVDDVEDELTRSFDREVPTEVVGKLVADRLRRLDQVAYVRFASVYRRFKTVEELMDEARAVIDAQRFEDPTQGKLFYENTKSASTPAAGTPRGTPGEEPPAKTRRRPPAKSNGHAGSPDAPPPADAGPKGALD